MRWPWQRPVEERSSWSISDPVLAEFFSVGPRNLAGVPVNEGTALGLSAVWRAVSLISQTIASVPLRTLRDAKDGTRQQVPSFLDAPGGPDGLTPFEWTETVMAHLLLHGNAYLAHTMNGGGALAALTPIHPLAVTPEWQKVDGKPTGLKEFTVSLDDGSTRTFDTTTMTQIMALSLDGLKGLSPIAVARNSLGTAIAGDRAAARQFGNGAMIAGLVTPEEDVTEDEAKLIKEGLNAKIAGVDNAGDIAVINRKLKFQPWTMSNEDAQFLESRQFQIEEIARWYGLPSFMLNLEQKSTSWGSGIDSMQQGMARTVLSPWAQRIEQRLSRLLSKNQFAEFDLTGLERANPADEIRLLLEQVEGGLLTVNEARAIRNLPPLPPESTPEPPATEEVPA